MSAHPGAPPAEERPRRVLLLRRRAFGDLLLTLPAIEALRRHAPRDELDLAVDPPLVEAARAWAPVDRVVPFPDRSAGAGPARWAAVARFAGTARRRGYDLAVDFHSTPHTALVTWLSGAPVRVGLDRRGRRWAYTRLVPRSVERQGGARSRYTADALLDFVRAAGVTWAEPARAGCLRSRIARQDPSAAGAVPSLALAPGATWGAKGWPRSSYGELARRAMAERGARVTIYWGPGEEATADAVAAAAPGARKAPRGTLLDLARGLAEESLLVSGDSGARHLAIALGVPTVGLFGPTDPWGSTPPGGEHLWLRHPIACAPCQRLECPLRENYCLTRIDPDAVWQVVRARLDASGASGPA